MTSRKSVKIVVKDGNIRYIHDDRIDLSELGDVQVCRASNVEFNNQTKLWEAHTVQGELICATKKRDDAIKKEIEFLEERL